MFPSIHIIRKLNAQDDPAVNAVATSIRHIATACDVAVVGLPDIYPNTLIIAVGGDGTMLEAMRLAARHDATALGVNLGRVGFLSDLNIKDPRYGTLESVLQGLLSGTRAYYVEDRMVLVTNLDDSQIAGNEVSISPRLSDSMLTYHLKVGGVSAGLHRANSLLIATANGSTAYSLSAGGALMMPGLNAMQIVPVAPMTMTSRPLIVSGDATVTISARGRDLTVRTDGQVAFEAADTLELTVRRYLRPAKVLHLAEWNYFDALTQKLGWQQD